MLGLQIWNRNPCSGIVAAMNVQGSSWDRRRRQFFQHDPQPRPLTGTIRPCDVPVWHQMAPDDEDAPRQLQGTAPSLETGCQHVQDLTCLVRRAFACACGSRLQAPCHVCASAAAGPHRLAVSLQVALVRQSAATVRLRPVQAVCRSLRACGLPAATA